MAKTKKYSDKIVYEARNIMEADVYLEGESLDCAPQINVKMRNNGLNGYYPVIAFEPSIEDGIDANALQTIINMALVHASKLNDFKYELELKFNTIVIFN